MRVEVITCMRLSAETASVISSHRCRPSPVDSRSSRMAIGVREPSIDQCGPGSLEEIVGQPFLGPRRHRSQVLAIHRRVTATALDAASEPRSEGISQPMHARLIQFLVQEQDHVKVHIPARRCVVNKLRDANVAAHTIGPFVGCPTRPPHQRRPPRLQARPQRGQTVVGAVAIG